MKKLISLALCLVLLVGMTACGGNSETDGTTAPTDGSILVNPSSEETTDNTDTQPTIPNVGDNWIYTEMALPNIPELVIDEQLGDTLPRATTPFSCDLDAFKALLDSMPFFQENFPESVKSSEESISFSNNQKRSAQITDEIILYNNQNGSLQFTFWKEASLFNNYYAIQVRMDKVEMTGPLQAALIDAFKQMNLDVMEYVLAAKDPNGKDANNEDFPGDVTNDSLFEYIKYDGHGYRLSRTIYADGNYHTFQVEATRSYSFGDNVNAEHFVGNYETLPYQLSDHLPDTFGCTDPLNGITFGDQLLSNLFKGYKSGQVETLVTDVVNYSDGSNGYSIAVRFTYDDGDILKDKPVITLGISYTVKDGTITGTNAGLHISDFYETTNGASQETLFHDGLELIKTLLPGIDVSAIDYDANETRLAERTTYSVLGIQNEERLMITYSAPDMDFAMNMQFLLGLVAL